MTTGARSSSGLRLLRFSLVAVVVIFGFTRTDNEEFTPQNEFKLDTWVDLPGPMDINKAVMYLVIAGVLTVGTMIWIAGKMQDRPNRVQTAVEALYSLMRDNITYGNIDSSMAKKWFPFIGTLFLFIWFSNLIGYIPLPTNTEHTSTSSASRSRPSRSTPPPRTCRSRSCSR